eukprot:354545-Chlamydomonas_euryale.AAC.4
MSEFNGAVESAKAAFPKWRDTPIPTRTRVMLKYQELIRDNMDSLAESVTAEQGKTLSDAKGDVFRGLEVVEAACGIAPFLMGEVLENVASGIDCKSVRQPLGVRGGRRGGLPTCVSKKQRKWLVFDDHMLTSLAHEPTASVGTGASHMPTWSRARAYHAACAAQSQVVGGICPFNFPAMVPLWMIPMAVTSGNTMVLKPSERDPGAAMMLADLAQQAGLPK